MTSARRASGTEKRKRDGMESKLIAGSIFHLAAWSPKVLFIRGNCNYSTIYRMMLPYMSAPYKRTDVCTHRERERETSGKDTRQAENRIDARYFYDRDSVKRSAGTIFHGFRGTWLIYLTSSFPLLSLSHKEVHSYLEKTRL